MINGPLEIKRFLPTLPYFFGILLILRTLTEIDLMFSIILSISLSINFFMLIENNWLWLRYKYRDIEILEENE